MHITPSELALATVGISALTAFVTLWNGRVGARTQLRVSDAHQRGAVLERLWEAKSKAYVDALWLIEWWEKTFREGSSDRSAKALRDADRYPSWDQLLGASVNAFGTPEVRLAFHEMIQAFENAEHGHDVVHGHAAGDSAKALSDLPDSRRRAIEMARRLSDLIRAELQPQPEGS